MAKYNEIKAIQEALVNKDIDTASTLLATLKTELVGADNTRYRYQCIKCGLNCIIESGLDKIDTKFCLDEMRSGNGNFIQKDVKISA